MRLRVLSACALLVACGCAAVAQQPAGNAPGVPAVQPAATPANSRDMISRAIAYLRTQQDKESGGWAVNPQGPNFPAITGLVITGMLMDPAIDDTDDSVQQGVKFIINYAQADGGIYDRMLPSYNTSICLTALTGVTQPPQVADVVARARDYLKTLQYGEGAVTHTGHGESAQPVDKSHAFYGGIGYGNHGRPDLSNTQWVLEALHASGVDGSDAAFQRALVFLQRIQMVEERDGMKINDMPYAKGSTQGGFVYATSVNKDQIGVGQSQAGMIDETLSDGTTASRLRAYGSMTYAGFKSYLYAGLKKDDPRVLAALEWISRNYTVAENPGIGTDGQYYFYVVFARAMAARGEATLPVIGADGAITQRRWARDLIEQLATLQNEDGSFRSVDDRWMENNPVLITAYSLIALQEAAKYEQSK